MFDSSTAIRVFGFPRHPRKAGVQTTVTEAVEIAGVDSKVDVQKEKRVKDEAWRRPEWWEYHHYERR
jgi:hypothetical protein